MSVEQPVVRTYPEPIDALSAEMPSENSVAFVSAQSSDGAWGVWQELHWEDEQDPLLTESNLIVFAAPAKAIRIRGSSGLKLHPIRVSHDPPAYQVAATSTVGSPKILTRAEWGADESLLWRKPAAASSSSSTVPSASSSSDAGGNDDNGGTDVSKRVQDCLAAQENYPSEFRASPPVMRDKDGQPLRWPWTYSTQVKLLVVHHTAQSLDGDLRSGVERMRAIYQYHGQNRGWGDIGYHYVIDEKGQIYEGKAGGDFVIGGHAYCNNTNTISVAMMGNFDVSKPPQVQMQSLQWLLKRLADRYRIDVSKAVQYHGIQLPAIVGHRQLVSTDCPGEYVWRTLDQVRDHVAMGNTDDPIVFPKLERTVIATPQRRTSSTTSARPTLSTVAGFQPLGGGIEGRPGGDVIIPVLFRADKEYAKGSRIGKLWRSRHDLLVSQERDGKYVPARAIIYSPVKLTPNALVVIRLRVHLPLEKGIFSIKADDVNIAISAAGRRSRVPSVTSSYQSDSPPIEGGLTSPPEQQASMDSTGSPQVPALHNDESPLIRIRLHDSVDLDSVTLRTNGAAQVNRVQLPGEALVLSKNGSLCTATEDGRSIQGSILRVTPADGNVTLTSWKKSTNRFRGVIECRVINDELILINELSLEDYLLGLSEEPDTEPAEKQKAFGIAARTYAAWYLDEAHRKFPGKPYDGSDSPAEFQAYGGMVFEDQNPRWVSIAKRTSGQVLLFGGQLIKPPYFSSDDGRTRTPAEAGWADFPFEALFVSKPDPWCKGLPMRGHGVGMSGCGAKAQAEEGKTAEEILKYYYRGVEIGALN